MKKTKNSCFVKVPAVVQASCYLLATFNMTCPLCDVMVPGHTIHRCERRQADAPAVKPRRRPTPKRSRKAGR